MKRIKYFFHLSSFKDIFKFIFNIVKILILVILLLIIIFIVTIIIDKMIPNESYFNIVALIIMASVVEIGVWYKSLTLNKKDFWNIIKDKNIKLTKIDRDNIPDKLNDRVIMPYSSLLFTAISLLSSFLLTNMALSNKYYITWVFVIFTVLISVLFDRRVKSNYNELLDEYAKDQYQINIKLDKHLKDVTNEISALKSACKQKDRLYNEKVNELQRKNVICQVKLYKINKLSHYNKA